MKELEKIAFERLGVITCPEGAETPETRAIILAELANVGVRVMNPDMLNDSMLGSIADLVKEVRSWRGEKRRYVPLFAGFPDELPAFDDFQVRFSVARARLLGNPNPTDQDIREALDFTDQNWWPASSVPQDVNRTLQQRVAEEARKGDGLVRHVDVTVIRPEQLEVELKAFMIQALCANSSLREDVREDVKMLGETYGFSHVPLVDVKFRESRVLLLEALWNEDLKKFAVSGATPDDILRLMAQLTGTDVSLTSEAKWPKLSRAQRRAIVSALEASPRLGELFRRRGMWLGLSRALHIGEYDAPKTQEAFKRLRDSRHDKSSTASRFEELFKSDLQGAVELLASEAPSTLLRQIRRVLAATKASQMADIRESLTAAAKQAPLKLLLNVRAQLHDNGVTYPRVVFTKTGGAQVVDREPGHLAAPATVQQEALRVIDEAIAENIRVRESWAGLKVFIEDSLEKVLLPEQLRAASAGMLQAERGSRFSLGEGDVVRLFTHWKGGGVDLDLSAMALDDNFELLGQVSWTQLTAGAMTHSGDITSAPVGAEEFIDINLEQARKKGWRYIAGVIFRYASPPFGDLEEAGAGWMMRQDCSSDRRTFDAATVMNAFPLTGAGRTSVPLLIDLKTREAVVIDVYLKGHPGARVERDGQNISLVARLVQERKRLRTTVKDIVDLHVTHRGATYVEDPNEADISFGLQDSMTFNVMRPEKLLSELL